jgi:Na+-translocating ferredoxin:NAD+ oxidoreductase RNF subunit RnfB
LGIALAYASRIFAVKRDKRIEEVENMLPGINCGACGYPGCSGYAEAIVNEEAEITLCSPGGPETAAEIAETMGLEVDLSQEKMVAQVHCRGTDKTSSKKYKYEGIEDCNAMYSSFSGDKDCPYGCLGLGSCIKVCPADAIVKTEAGWIDIDKDKCISCEKCVAVCPTGVIKMIPCSASHIVACNSTDKGGIVRKYCSVGCIGCKICEKKSPEGGFKVVDFLAVIDHSATGSRAEAVEVCPAKCIIDLDVAD